MKRISKIISCLTLVLLSRGICLAQNHKLDSVKIEFVGFNVETDVDISCDVFDYTFNNGKQKIKKSVRNITDLAKFQALSGNFKLINKKQSFNVRGKVIYYRDNISEKYCFDVFGCFYKNGKLYHNKKLMIFLTDLLYRHHPKYLDTLRYHE